jgi:aminoglycoside phosphotransferase (APT) family kinase protein
VEGEPFRRRAAPSASGSHVQAALDRLLELATAPAPPATAEPREVATVLEDLLLRFVEVYRPDARESAFLAGQISSIAGSERPVPVAFQHGDPGTWNLLARPGGNVAFLDWEAAELRGMPLWDVFYFLRSFGVFLARARGTRDALKAFEQQFLTDGGSSRLLAESVDRYCERTGLDRPLVEPLFHTCWLHRSLKEATRLTPDRLQQGHYVRLLRLGIDRRASAPLRRVFDGSAP